METLSEEFEPVTLEKISEEEQNISCSVVKTAFYLSSWSFWGFFR